MNPSSRQIEERAAEWLARRDSGRWSEDDEHQLQQWLDGSTAHTVAFLRLEAAWTQALRMKAFGAGTQPRGVPPPDAWRQSPFFERSQSVTCAASTDSARQEPARRRLLSALAAGLLVAVAGALAWYSLLPGSDYRTPVGGMAAVPMTDGSEVTLNTDSAIRVAVTERERSVQLQQGEAFFEVAKDHKRPFVVSAGNKRVIAVGTKFAVRRNGNNVRVFVTEGKVRFEDDSLSASQEASGSAPPAREPRSSSAAGAPGQALVAGMTRGEGGAILLPAGTIARADESGVLIQEKSLPEVEEYLSWRSGYLIFHETTLADAIGEFNRYNEHKLVIGDSQVAALRLSGKFRATNFEGFVRLLEEGFPIRARHEAGRTILANAYDPDAPTAVGR